MNSYEFNIFAFRLIFVFDHTLHVHIGFGVVFRGVSSPEILGCRSNVHVHAAVIFTNRVTGFGKIKFWI